MTDKHPADQTIPRECCKLISCLLPDDGTDKKLMQMLMNNKEIIRANSTSCMGLAVLADAKTTFDELPEPALIRKVEVVISANDADDLYDYIYETANIGRPQGGVIWMAPLAMVSPFDLPDGVPLEGGP